MDRKCSWPRCGSTDIELTYYGKTLCKKHWHKTCDVGKEQALTKLKIKGAQQ